jgi:hypothetical protein
MIGFDWAVGPWLLQATLAGLGTRPTVTTAAGSARVGHQYGLLGASYPFGSAAGFRPFVGLAAGLLRSSVEGRAETPKQGHALEKWSMLLDGSVGVAFELPRHYYLTMATHVQLAEPYVAIRFLNETVATAGRPNLLLTLTLGGWL